MHDGTGVVELVPQGTDAEPESIKPSFRLIARALLVLAVNVLLWAVVGVRVIAGRFVAQLFRLYVHLFVQANSKAKCPACGVRVAHDVRWSTDYKALVHLCKRCFAAWTEQPMVKAELWASGMAPIVNDDGSVTDADGVRTGTIQHAQRNPQLIREVKLTGRDKPIVIQGPGGVA